MTVTQHGPFRCVTAYLTIVSDLSSIPHQCETRSTILFPLASEFVALSNNRGACRSIVTSHGNGSGRASVARIGANAFDCEPFAAICCRGPKFASDGIFMPWSTITSASPSRRISCVTSDPRAWAFASAARVAGGCLAKSVADRRNDYGAFGANPTNVLACTASALSVVVTSGVPPSSEQ